MNKAPKKDLVETGKGQAGEITGNTRDDKAMEVEYDLRMNAGKDRVGFVAFRRKAKKGDKNDRY
ncbi:hypothetical protein ACH5Y9_10795 [Methylomonas sp. BW4-1]|uniref:hypothetical protein n=1 Tax=Methylomonas sp. BW4-1 TaxID=3376685 RepID=UPI004042F6FA